MNVRLLVDGIVRQTTLLIAQLSTAAGVRAPLAHVADQVFLDLAREIEAQGVGRKVAADMFGLALRSYQKKIQRITESATDHDQTLWQAVLGFLRDGSKSRLRIGERFAGDGEKEVGAVLSDLVSSGLAYCTGRGDSALYGLTSEADLHAVAADQDARSVANVVWLQVFSEDAQTEGALAARLGLGAETVASAVALLVRDRRLRRRDDGTLIAENVVIPVGATEGWEAAILDHFRAMATAVAAKVAAGVTSKNVDEIGGATLTFRLRPGHPREAEVRGLLRDVRARVSALWAEATAESAGDPQSDDDVQVTFYFGQMVTLPHDGDGKPASEG